MTAEAKQFSPELIHLLADILADPSSVFSRLSRMRPSLLFDKPISKNTPFLSKPERHILTRYRAEVARLLYEGCMLTLQSANAAQTNLVLTKRLVDESRWDSDVRKVFRSPARRLPPESKALRSGVEGKGFGSEEARLSLSLEPTPGARFALVSMLRMEERFADCSVTATDWCRREVDANWRGVATSMAAEAFLAQGMREDALRWYRESATGRLPGRTAAVCWMIQSLCLRREADISASLQQVESNEEDFGPARGGFFRVVGDHYLQKLGVPPTTIAAARKSAEMEGLDFAGEVLDALV